MLSLYYLNCFFIHGNQTELVISEVNEAKESKLFTSLNDRERVEK